MIPIHRIANKNLENVVGNASLLLFGAFCLAVSQPVAALADDGYVPPSGRARPQRTQGGGARGCPNTRPVSLQLLIPNDHTALTTASRPTFAWYLSEVPSMPLQFALTETGSAQPIIVRELPVVRSGIMQYTLPPDAESLQSGKEYRWTVSLICNPERPSQSVYARGWVELTPMPPSLAQQLTTSTTALQKAAIYARAGIWYDAVATLLDRTSDKVVTEKTTLLQALLGQVGLRNIIADRTF